MSIYDDADNGSGTLVYCDHWVAAEPNSSHWVAGHIFREAESNFLICVGCYCYCDPSDVVTGDFGDLHCGFCGVSGPRTAE